MAQPAMDGNHRALLWVMVASSVLGAACLLVAVVIRPSSFAYLLLLGPAVAMVVGGIALLRRDSQRRAR